MRLYELLAEYTFPEIKNRGDRDRIPDLYDYDDEEAYVRDTDLDIEVDKRPKYDSDPKVKKLGTGAFATAYKHQDTPHDVTKGSKATFIPDGFEAFFIALSKDEEAQANPYFPRFRSISRFQTKNRERSSYVTKIESLEKFSVLSKEEIEMLLNKLFTERGLEIINEYVNKRLYKPLHDDPAWYLGNGILHSFENSSSAKELRTEIKDRHFLDAVLFIKDVAKEYDYKIDMHKGNMMVRRISVGPQLVLNDPLGFSHSDPGD